MRYILAFLLLQVPAVGTASTATFRVQDSDGRALSDAVITVHPASGVPSGAIRFPWAYEMVQENVAFSPGVLIVPEGATVRFPNRDRVRHHVYSFASIARFEIRLYGRDQTRSQQFNRAGTVPLGCNIHDQMSAYIRVVDTPYAAKTNGEGRLSIDGLPAGRARVTLWHPRIRSEDNERSYTLDIPASGRIARTITPPTRRER